MIVLIPKLKENFKDRQIFHRNAFQLNENIKLNVNNNDIMPHFDV